MSTSRGRRSTGSRKKKNNWVERAKSISIITGAVLAPLGQAVDLANKIIDRPKSPDTITRQESGRLDEAADKQWSQQQALERSLNRHEQYVVTRYQGLRQRFILATKLALEGKYDEAAKMYEWPRAKIDKSTIRNPALIRTLDKYLTLTRLAHAWLYAYHGVRSGPDARQEYLLDIASSAYREVLDKELAKDESDPALSTLAEQGVNLVAALQDPNLSATDRLQMMNALLSELLHTAENPVSPDVEFPL